MATNSHNDKTDADARRSFLEEGARSYFEAATAIVEYQRIVEMAARSTFAKHVNDLTVASKIDFYREKIETAVIPVSNTEWDGKWTQIGAKIEGFKNKLTKDWCGAFCLLGWDRNDAKLAWFGASVGVWMPKRKLIELENKMNDARISDVIRDHNSVSLSRNLSPEDSTNIEDVFDQLLVRWIDALKKVGGLKQERAQ